MPRSMILISLGMLLGLAACASANSQSTPTPTPATQFMVETQGTGDRVDTLSETGQVVFSVFSTSGIGSARISVLGEWPPQIVLRFYLEALENLRLEYTGTQIQLSVPVSQPDMTLRSLTLSGGSETPIVERSSPYWMPVSLQDTGQSEGTYYEVLLPSDFYDSQATEFNFSWIDFYR